MAEEESIEDSLKELLKCPVCLEINDSLKALRCQHTICFSCLQQLTTRNNRFKCPSCNQEELIPSGGLELLANCLLTQQVAHILSRKKTVKPTLTSESDHTAPADKCSSSISALLPPGGAFGFVPSSKKMESPTSTTKQTAMSDVVKGRPVKGRKVKVKPTPRKQAPVKPEVKKVDVVKLREDLLKVVKLSQGWCKYAEEKMSTYRKRLTFLPESAQRCTSSVKAYQRKMEEVCKKKIAAVKERQKFEIEVHQKNNKALEPYIKQMEETTQKVARCSKKINGKKRISTAAVGEAQKWAIELKHLNGQARRVPHGPGCDEFLRGGNSVMLRWIPYSEYSMRKFVNGHVNHASLGVFIHERKSLWRDDHYHAAFPEVVGFTCIAGYIYEIKTEKRLPFVGDKVRRKNEESGPSGILLQVDTQQDFVGDDGYGVVVEYFGHVTWSGFYSEIELIPGWKFEVGDKVRVSRRIPEPSKGWGGVNGSSVGVVLSLQDTDGQEEFVVNFPECNVWVGSAADLELAREPVPADEVQVKLSVKTPLRGWRSVTHEDCGVLRSVSSSTYYGAPKAVVQFPSNANWECELSEIEPSRYQSPAYEKQFTSPQTQLTNHEPNIVAALRMMRGGRE